MEYIKSEYNDDPEGTKKKYPEVFYYFEGLKDCVVSQSQHPAGIVAAPMNLVDYCGMFLGTDGQQILPLDMDMCHALGLIKYDILGLKTIGVIDKTCKMMGQYFPRAHEVDFNDQAVYEDMTRDPLTIFQFESLYAQDNFKKMQCHSIEDITLVNAAMRPSGASYRDKLFRHEYHDNGSKLINDVLQESYGYIAFQEEVTAFLQYVCGFSGSDADSVRRAIGKKDSEKIAKALPKILEGYCAKSDKPREIAEQEAKNFLKVIEDSGDYMFNKNHALGYSLLSYLCGYYRYYYPIQYCTAYLSCAKNDEDLFNGQQLARTLNIKLQFVKFRFADWDYSCDADNSIIYKGMSDIPKVSEASCRALRSLYDTKYDSFTDLLKDMILLKLHTDQIDGLIKMDYFSEFGDINYLLGIMALYKKYQNRKKKWELIAAEVDNIKQGTTTLYNKMCYAFDLTKMVGYVDETIPDKWYFVTEIKGTNYKMYQISTGQTRTYRIRKKLSDQVPVDLRNIISIQDVKSEGKWLKSGDDWVQSKTDMEDVIKKYQVLKKVAT